MINALTLAQLLRLRAKLSYIAKWQFSAGYECYIRWQSCFGPRPAEPTAWPEKMTIKELLYGLYGISQSR